METVLARKGRADVVRDVLTVNDDGTGRWMPTATALRDATDALHNHVGHKHAYGRCAFLAFVTLMAAGPQA